MTFMLASSSLTRFIPVRHINVPEPAPFDGYEAWLDSLTFGQERPADAPIARRISAEEWAAIVGDPTPEPPAPLVENLPQVAPRTRKPFDQAGRDERGRELAERAVIVGAGNVYLVSPSDRTAEPYTVDLVAASCSCPDHANAITRERENGNHAAACKHLVATRLVAQKRVAS